mmetsp:Transcript_21494/g.30897  ORF Transcript_21494/g.30897 Transcript_21494/m.30897 type:complete len:262 (-) Transcript_21494:30-815(-)
MLHITQRDYQLARLNGTTRSCILTMFRAIFLAGLLVVAVQGFSFSAKDSGVVDGSQVQNKFSRRDLFKSIPAAAAAAAASFALVVTPSQPAYAARESLDQCLYLVLRAKEATQQESRLINSGKFKDMQRANVKLAVKFILQNYKLSDTVIAASAYLSDNSRRVTAGEAGQAAVQDLLTILEYFDSSDVQNLKVGALTATSGKEQLVLKGLDSARKNIDGFLSYFPSDQVEAMRKKILEENELNYKEWDPALGEIVNLPPTL